MCPACVISPESVRCVAVARGWGPGPPPLLEWACFPSYLKVGLDLVFRVLISNRHLCPWRAGVPLGKESGGVRFRTSPVPGLVDT